MQPDPIPEDPTPGMHLWGWMSPAELTWLGEQAAKMNSVVEIGCLHGRSSFALATACPGTVYCIDPWSDAGWRSWKRSVGDVFDNVIPIRQASPGAAKMILGDVDMVFIDGAHDYDSVVADILGWKDKTTKLLCGHDYVPYSALGGNEPGFPDVSRAVNELLGEENITVADETAIWAWHPPA